MLKYTNVIRIIMMLVIVLVASIFIPDFYWKANKHETNRTNVYYSPIKKCFVLVKSDVREINYFDAKGNKLNRDEFEEYVPFVNFRQLMLTGKLPAVIDSISIVPREVNLNNVTLRVNPVMINSRPLQLYPLFESASGRVRLELSADYFRIDKRMEFVTSITNEVNEEKSILFTNALQKEGFSFPSKRIYGNPTTKKPFDEGYFVVDNSNKIFHIKMVKGKPFCKNIGVPSNLGTVFISVIEYELREFYGMIITDKNEAYFISYDNYKLIKLSVENYNHQENTLQIKGDLFYRILIVNKENGFNAVVTNRDYKVIDKYSESRPGKDSRTAGIISSYIFPFTVSIEKETTPFINFYFNFSDARCLILSFILFVVTAFYFRKKNVPVKKIGYYSVLVLLTGIYGFLAILAVKDFEDDPGISKN